MLFCHSEYIGQKYTPHTHPHPLLRLFFHNGSALVGSGCLQITAVFVRTIPRRHILYHSGCAWLFSQLFPSFTSIYITCSLNYMSVIPFRKDDHKLGLNMGNLILYQSTALRMLGLHMQMDHICMPFEPVLTRMGEEMSVDSPRGC